MGCFQNPQSCPWLVFRSNQFGPQNPNSKIDTKNPTRRHTDQGKLHTWWRESSFVFDISHFSSAECSEVMSKRTQKDSGEEKSHSKVETNDEFGRAIQRKDSRRACFLLHQNARRKPDTKVKLLWVRKLRSTIERRHPLYAHTQASQNRKLIRLGLLKSGNLMNWWMIERGDLLFAHSTPASSLMRTMRRIRTPKQNQYCRQDPDHSNDFRWTLQKTAKHIL